MLFIPQKYITDTHARLGRLKADDVPELLQAILERPRRPFTALDPPLLPAHWRGRTGLAKDEQVELFTSHQAH